MEAGANKYKNIDNNNKRGYNMARTYFAEFRNIENDKLFYKFGHTSFKDAQQRLNEILKDTTTYKARILVSAYHHNIEKCKEFEEELKVKYPKNFWLEEKLSGVTECLLVDFKTRQEIIGIIKQRSEEFKDECFGRKQVDTDDIDFDFKNEE